jgi:23S rRNA pseudouridine2604 synthase
MKIRALLVKRMCISNERALAYIQGNLVQIDGRVASEHDTVEKQQQVSVENQIIQTGKQHFYIAYHKPKGVECTLNRNIPNNLTENIGIEKKYFPVGRLDKESEGLLLLTNDGVTYKELLSNAHEKEYIVEVSTELTDDFFKQFSEGVTILGKRTMPCEVSRISTTRFRVILREGMNRQIRRMCYKLGYKVTSLVRIRFAGYTMQGLKAGEYKEIRLEELLKIKPTQIS